MARESIDRVDLLCTEHNNATLTSPTGRVTVLVPVDKYSDDVDYSLGWEFDFDELQCPVDPDGNCVDSWEVFPVT